MVACYELGFVIIYVFKACNINFFKKNLKCKSDQDLEKTIKHLQVCIFLRRKANKSFMANTNSLQNKFLIIIAGPTASGKTNMAIQIAQRFDAEIFSCDSRQLYREMTIGTAKPDQSDLNTVKHHFIDHISIQQPYSVGHYSDEMQSALDNYFKHKNIAVITGGTGLYLKAVVEGLNDFPDVPPEIVQDYQSLYEREGITNLQNELLQLDPSYYNKVDLNNPRRLIRALSIIKLSGKTFTSFLEQTNPPASNYHQIPILLELPREVLYKNINARVDIMMEMGLLQEAERLFPYRNLPALNTVGYTEIFSYLSGETILPNAIELIKQNSRRYAKRQLTWFRKYGNWNTFSPDDYPGIESFIVASLPESGLI